MNNQIVKKLLQPSILIQMISFVLAFVCIFYVANVGSPMQKVPEEYTPALVLLIIGLLLQAGTVVMNIFEIKYSNYVRLAVAVVITLALSMFICGSVLSVIDKIYNIVMWGDSTQFPAIMAFGVLLGISTIADIVVCWFK